MVDIFYSHSKCSRKGMEIEYRNKRKGSRWCKIEGKLIIYRMKICDMKSIVW